jgi:hypothetical protein
VTSVRGLASQFAHRVPWLVVQWARYGSLDHGAARAGGFRAPRHRHSDAGQATTRGPASWVSRQVAGSLSDLTALAYRLRLPPAALCGEPATGWGYDGLDPNEQRDPHTGLAWSADMTHYRPVCPAH